MTRKMANNPPIGIENGPGFIGQTGHLRRTDRPEDDARDIVKQGEPVMPSIRSAVDETYKIVRPPLS